MKCLLIIDCGHSRTKFHLYRSKSCEHLSCDNAPFVWPKEIHAEQIDECLLMGTNERMLVRYTSHWKQMGGVTPHRLGKDCRVPIEKKCGSGTGNDRMVHALGAMAKHPDKRVLVISAGSALVVDLVNQGVLEGGLIGLGWRRYCKAMLDLNPNLKASEIAATFPGASTLEAVALGWKQSVKALVNSLAAQYAIDEIMLTGGDAAMLQNLLPEAEVNPYLGLDRLAQAMGYEVSVD